tara:strand:+ start:191481 stop:192161 length:681 start_codon:yes stop_codon:yes gene_type:complete
MKLYELVGRDKSNSFSPFVWRAKLALAHKGFEYETVPLHFTEIKETLSFADAKTVPILVDGDKVTTDSWEICTYLEDTYPERPSLFQSRSAARLFTFQLSMPLLVPLFRTIVADIYDVIDDSDKDYFRATREPRIGCTIEEAALDFEASFSTFKTALWPYQQYFSSADFIGGEAPTYQDYALYSTFLWARGTSSKKLLEDDDSIVRWLARMDGLLDGLGKRVKKID